MLTEQPTNQVGNGGFTGSATAAAGPVAGFDPVLISLIRRSMPNLVAYDLAGVQPMSGPTGLIFAMRSRYTNQSGTEAFFDEVLIPHSLVRTKVSMTPTESPTLLQVWVLLLKSGTNPAVLNPTLVLHLHCIQRWSGHENR